MTSTAQPLRLSRASRHGRAADRFIGHALPSLALLLFPVLLWRGWARWNDVLIDFGRELYVPWRLSLGEVLYRDIAYFNGPFSAYWNMLAFDLFGVGLTTLLWVNAGVASGTAVLLWLVLRRVGGPVSAGAGVLFFTVLACGHFVVLANYNFLAPYSHEMTHGLVLSLGALLTALTWDGGRGRGRLALMGLLLGGVFLTKPEIFAASVVGVGIALVLTLHATGAPMRGALARMTVVPLAAGIPPLVACGLLATAMPWKSALSGVLGGWVGGLGTDIAELPFYQGISGFDRPGPNSLLVVGSLGRLLLLLGPAVVIDLVSARQRRLRILAAAVVFVVTVAFLTLRSPDAALLAQPGEGLRTMRALLDLWKEYTRHLPLTTALSALAALLLYLRAGDREQRLAWARRTAFAAFALALLAKIMLNVTLGHYGFALAVPAVMLAIVVGLEWIPAGLRALGGSGLVMRACVSALLLATGVQSWMISEAMFSRKTVAVGRSPDRFFSDAGRGRAVNLALREVEERFPPEASILVMPEGIMLNYLTRRRTPTRHINFMPPELILFGEAEILEELRSSPPDAVILVHKDTQEYGYRLFGRQYGVAIMRWIRERYPVGQIVFGDPPLREGSRFGVEFLTARAPGKGSAEPHPR
jgi:hypothetical protein